MRAFLPLAASASVAAASLAALRAAAVRGWCAPTGLRALEYCEALRPGLVKQPVNTWSNLGFIAVGLAIGVAAWRDASRDRAPLNRMRDSIAYPTLYAALATFLGPGSMALHASTTAWGSKVDMLSMQIWIAFPIAYGAARLKNLATRGFAAVYAGLVAFLAVNVLVEPIRGTFVFAILVAALCFFELAVYRAARAGGRYAFLLTAAAAFALATAVWLPSHTGGPLCVPDSPLQGHAAWHLLGAVAVGAIYLFYRSETVPA